MSQESRLHLNVNEKFFDTWTPESCYVFGFLLADGCFRESFRKSKVTGKKYSMPVKTVSFDNEDHDIIRSISQVMGAVQKVRKVVQRGFIRYSLCIANKYLISRLEELGLEPRKSTKPMHIPESIPDELFHHFFRGYFDGDGCFKKGTMYIISTVVNDLGDQFKDIFKRLNMPEPHRYTHLPKNGKYKVEQLLWYKLEDRRIISNWMYKDAIMFMKSKRERARKWLI